jgi:hypothetical protein
LKPLSRLLHTSFFVCLVLVTQAGLAQERPQISEVPRGSWATAPRHSAAIASNPVQLIDMAIVQIYAAPTYGWRDFFAVHPWIIFKRKGGASHTRFDVVGWRAPQVVQRNYALPDGLWYGSPR